MRRIRFTIASLPVVIFTVKGGRLATSSQGVVRLWDATTGKLSGGWTGTTENFIRIGQSLFALLVGWLGAQFSRRLYVTSRARQPSTAVDVEGTHSRPKEEVYA